MIDQYRSKKLSLVTLGETIVFTYHKNIVIYAGTNRILGGVFRKLRRDGAEKSCDLSLSIFNRKNTIFVGISQFFRRNTYGISEFSDDTSN